MREALQAATHGTGKPLFALAAPRDRQPERVELDAPVDDQLAADIALLKVTPKKPLPSVKFGSSEAIKVGDWVVVGNTEGVVRSISVRATEIQMGDRSTVIVPNSEFITKIVRNVTYGESLGMVQFKLPMPLATDTTRARAIILEAFRSHPSVLGSPAPNVQLDGINAEGTNLILNASGFVNSPRAAYGVKSDLLFDVLDRLRKAGLLPGQKPVPVEEGSVEGDSKAPPAPGV